MHSPFLPQNSLEISLYPTYNAEDKRPFLTTKVFSVVVA